MKSVGTKTENRFAEVFGSPNERAINKLQGTLSDEVKNFIAGSPFVIMATSDGTGRCDASPKGGKPGFVKVLDDEHLVVPDVAGNRLFQSYQNMDENAHVGLLFLIPGSNDTVRVNGSIQILPTEELAKLNITLSLNNPDDNAIQLQGILVKVEEAYPHCPRALKFSELWNVEDIERQKESTRRKR